MKQEKNLIFQEKILMIHKKKQTRKELNIQRKYY